MTAVDQVQAILLRAALAGVTPQEQYAADMAEAAAADGHIAGLPGDSLHPSASWRANAEWRRRLFGQARDRGMTVGDIARHYRVTTAVVRRDLRAAE